MKQLSRFRFLSLPGRHVAVVSISAAMSLALLTTCQQATRTPPGHRRQADPIRMPIVAAPVPVVAPVDYRPVTAEQALEINAEPVVPEDPGAAARSFAGEAAVKSTALDCLTSAVYYEAASESDNGERAVAQVVLNRVRHPAFPNSICGVVYQGAERPTGCQFTFACDGALARTPAATGWLRARRIATAALKGYVFKPVGNATHYHANWVVPYWASSLTRSATIGAHIFYRWTGGWGMPRAFFRRYSGAEPDVTAVLARWTGALPGPAPVPPVLVVDTHRLKLLEDTKVTVKSVKPTVLVADRESGGLIADLEAQPRLEADRHHGALKLDAR